MERKHLGTRTDEQWEQDRLKAMRDAVNGTGGAFHITRDLPEDEEEARAARFVPHKVVGGPEPRPWPILLATLFWPVLLVLGALGLALLMGWLWVS